MPKVLIAGYTGAMGRYATALVNGMADFEVTAGLAPHDAPTELPAGAKRYHSLAEVEAGVADIWLDFTVPGAVKENVTYALTHGFTPIVGTTGRRGAGVRAMKIFSKTSTPRWDS